MNPLLLTSLLLAASPNVTSSDWLSLDRNEFLAFRPLGEADSGVVWYMRSRNGSGKNEPRAFSGRYTLTGGNRIRVALTRAWEPVFDQRKQLWWARDWSYSDDPQVEGDLYAITLEVDVTPSGLVATAVSPEWVDTNGDRQRGDASSVYEHIRPGTVLDMQPAATHMFQTTSDPPGFVRHGLWTNRAASAPTSISSTDPLKTDLFGWTYEGTSESRFNGKVTVFSLQSGETWAEGTAWYISASTGRSQDYRALRGLYSIYGNKLTSQDALVLHFAATRSYRGTPQGNRIQWKMETEFDPVLFRLDLPLNDHAVPTPLVLSVESMDYADESGRAIARYTRDGFFSLPQRNLPMFAGGLSYRGTMKLDPELSRASLASAQSLLRPLTVSPPPGFRFRTDLVSHTVARPAQPSTPPAFSRQPAPYPPSGGSRTGGVASTAGDRQTAARNLQRGHQAEREKRYAAAIAAYRAVPQKTSEYITACNNIAWLKATCPDASVRNGRDAVAYATRACALTGYRAPMNLDTLAAAYAEAGDFTNAVRWQDKAVDLSTGDKRLGRLERLLRYIRNEPYRQP